ncbi:MAG: thiol-disulfide oxidoreductase DCC family protein [Microbacteriaceae bacterium]
MSSPARPSSGESSGNDPMHNPAVLVFDGDCGFCTSTANAVVRLSRVPVTAVAWQLTDVLQFGLTEQQTSSRVYLVLGEERFGGHLAFAYLLFIQPNWLLKSVGWLLTVPPFCWLASIGYALVSRFRHRLPGGTPACKLPSAG